MKRKGFGKKQVIPIRYNNSQLSSIQVSRILIQSAILQRKCTVFIKLFKGKFEMFTCSSATWKLSQPPLVALPTFPHAGAITVEASPGGKGWPMREAANLCL
jgi:hypothetical protein